MDKLEKISNPTEGMVAEIHGNLTTGKVGDKHVFFDYNGDYWEMCQ